MKSTPMANDLSFLDQTIQRVGSAPESVIPILQALQDHHGYLPEEALRQVCESTRITPASLAGVASFYDMFRHKPAGKHIIRVCRGTACHVTGAERVQEALRRELGIPAGDDTDAQRRFTIEEVACLGCCTLAPVVKIEQATFGHATAEKAPGLLREFEKRRQSNGAVRSTEEAPPGAHPNGAGQINIGLGSCCMAKGSDDLFHALRESVEKTGARVTVKRVGCVGICHRTPLIEVIQPGKPRTFYAGLGAAQARDLVLRHFQPRGLVQHAARLWTRAMDALLLEDPAQEVERRELSVQAPEVKAFLDRQVHIATEQFGKVDPLDLDEYLAHGGFGALGRAKAECKSRNEAASSPGADLLLYVGEASGGNPPHPGPLPKERESSRLSAGESNAVGMVERPSLLPPLPLGEGRGEGDSSAAAAPKTDLRPSDPRPSPLDPLELIGLIERSGLRGRGGAGFPTGTKWRLARQQPGEVKYVICNGDEGDPGAFMDRMLLESFPYRVIEGLAIAAVAVGAHEGIFYIRHEYPLAVKRVRAAIATLEERGWLGDRLFGTSYPLRLSIKEGAGAFVCGEETALIASIEGARGMPRLRPPFPAEAGLWGKPTVINNVETLAMVPWIVRHGAEAFAAYGTAASKGTKVFALAGNVLRGGLIEIPMGTTLREIVEEIGGGVRPGRKFKAVQIGGPSGGCVPARLADTPVDYESLRGAGAIMGSGGLVVLDDTACMVDIARYFLQFTQNQSCGKCTFCRVGTRRMLDILNRLCAGKGQRQDLDELERLANQVGAGSLCGLGKTAPNPVLTTLRYFREEYEAHLQGRCPAGKCAALIRYRVTDQCNGCTICAQRCPVKAIPMTPYQRHTIDLDKCTRCDACRQGCPRGAVEVV
jgi:NADH:ubiquinone oxidoreductase subunit F (NADH-binding)/NADH:ubiquinone oxidoreductase subunit E